MIKLFRHRKRGSTYELLGEAELQTTLVIGRVGMEGDSIAVYRGRDGRLWARFADEFHDGRFEDLFPERRWVPSAFMDKSSPSPTCTPDRWICGKLGDQWLIGPEDNDERKDFGCEAVDVGDRIDFSWHEPRGTADLVFAADGSWSLQGAYPEDWNWVWVDDEWELCGDTIEEIARQLRETGADKEGDSITLRFCKQGDEAFVLTVDLHGEPSFRPLEAEGEADAA